MSSKLSQHNYNISMYHQIFPTIIHVYLIKEKTPMDADFLKRHRSFSQTCKTTKPTSLLQTDFNSFHHQPETQKNRGRSLKAMQQKKCELSYGSNCPQSPI